MKKILFLSVLIIFSCSKEEKDSEENVSVENPTIMALLDRQKYIVESYDVLPSSGVGGRVTYDIDTSEGNQNNFYFSNEAFEKLIYERILAYESQNCESSIVGPGCDNNKDLNAYCISSYGNILDSKINDFGDYIDIRNRHFIWILTPMDENANRIRIEWHSRDLYRDSEKPGLDFSDWTFYAVNENILLNRSNSQKIDFVCSNEIFSF